MTEEYALRTKRGTVHLPTRANGHGLRFIDSTRCGKWTRDMTEVPFDPSAEHRCRRCWGQEGQK